MVVKRAISLLTLGVYLLFSQFIVKARVSTDFSTFSAEDTCVIKKLDTYESKRSCWHSTNTADIQGVYDIFAHLVMPGELLSVWQPIDNYMLQYPEFASAQAQAPPWEYWSIDFFLETYVGIVLLLF